MVFSSVPAYLDPPNWNNQQVQPPRANAGSGGAGGGGDVVQHLTVGPTATTAEPAEVGGLPSSSSVSAAAVPQQARPNSMAERARLARAPQPEPALNCPRCDSTNTKFCYYNNYSLSQPRHFCKTCRRYWTRGGSLRNVPVGGGCRRNKRSSKPSSSAGAASFKPSSSAPRLQLPGGSSTAKSTPGGTTSTIIPPTGLSSMSHHLPFMGTMHPTGFNLGLTFPAGFNPPGMSPVDAVDQFPVASGGGSTIGASLEQWRVQQQQFPFLGGVLELPPPQPMYQLELEATRAGTAATMAAFTLGQTSATTSRQEGSLKLLEDSKGLEMSLQRQYMAALRQGDGVWGGNGGNGSDGGGNGGDSWTMNIPRFHSSSAGGGGDGGGVL
ncbi:hypothetical protein GUJ93_ZPchr0013g33814 [Zizania palustris]|uniref:Dof zinc finger protein n=1 Tax=Zizania palustris TaxID=103762 RepID=A0A8J5WZP5_ZIZPA|nr:hypothetical protein GUJ93_ZPchr0013g33814 [Zizania palustris]